MCCGYRFCWRMVQSKADNKENFKSRTGFVMLVVLSFGTPSFRQKLPSELLRQSTSLSPKPLESLYLSHIFWKSSHSFLSYIFQPLKLIAVFEDNRSCISMSTGKKLTPRTKHLAIKYHHFREFVRKKIIQVFPIDIKERMADIFTKLLKGRSVCVS